ncbi:WD repeat-containing protein CG11141 [Diabrotica virgifera virgifera]|uniref:HPS5-like beta-propeller domain-containing protein n=1 Tax=Diabrotica virgifera virgifera TaxID=50390 RepID=A0ABM5L491_DIAVI|nr:WD repeat-containing protein CG11141 [Diabrotica virgifera virgifera]
MALYPNAIRQTLREWAPLTELFAKLPTKHQNGIFYQEIKLTCVDVLPEFIALGTNSGIVYWFDRNKKDMQRLRCENNISITALKIISTVDYMVACGNAAGNINIFQIPKSYPDNLPDSLKPKNKQVERYTVAGLHKASISAIDWSKNGMKLFSGDKNGGVVLTEIDFYMHICKSVEILNEAYEVVQLSYNQQRLLVSTTYRSIICQKLDKWKVAQVGTKDRKVLGSFGGIIYQHSEKPSDTCLYCTRPGLRMWISDVDGNVQKTLLFKELLTKECPEVPLINPISLNLKRLKPQKESSFGVLLPFNEKLLVTHNNDIVYILDPKEMTIIATVSHLRGVLHVATHRDEIFILEEDRSLVRISFRPETMGSVGSTTTDSFLPLNSLKDLTSKLQSSSIIPAIPPIVENIFNHDMNIHTDETIIMNAEEALESPARTSNITHDVQKKFEEIGKKEFEHNILFKKSRYKKKRKSLDTSTNSLSSNSSEERESNIIKPTIMNLSSVGVLPDLRSPESIKSDIEYKEKLLADILSLDKVKISNIEDNLESNNSESECDDRVISYEKEEDDIPKFDCDKLKLFENLEPLRVNYNPPLSTLLPKRQTSTHNIIDKKIDHIKEHASNMPTHKSATTPKIPDAPACMNIPNTWGLTNIHLRERSISVKSDESLSDWEFV